MKFSIGYQLPEPDQQPFADLVADYRQQVEEVYFPWVGMASGRADISTTRGYTDWSTQQRLEADLLALRRMGLKLNLLFNANCHGGLGVSEHLQNQVLSVLDHLAETVGGADVVTTASPAVAHIIRQHIPQLHLRASVNMRIGTVAGMSQLADLFDSFYVQRDYNRDLTVLRRLKTWADKAGKAIHLLANSGCLAFCSSQTFHDNLVAHERDVDETRNIPDWTPTACWRLLKDPNNWPMIMQATWIRPEDVGHYEPLVGMMKLATRMHANPRLVIDAYARGQYRGNLLDLMEPGYGPALAPIVIDSRRLPTDWFQKTSSCGRICESCDYCRLALNGALVHGEQEP